MKEDTRPTHTASRREAPATREEGRTQLPPVDIFEQESTLIVLADLPGVAKEDVNVSVDNDVLTIQAAPKSSLPGTPVHREFDLHTFHRQFQLSERVDQEKIRAEMKHGVLTVWLPKVESHKPKKIDIAVGG